MLKIINLCRDFRKMRAVDNLSLDVDEGEVFGLIGPNGAGKTTTMKIICGLIPSKSGKVYIDGMDITRYGMKARERVGYMPDFFGVYEDLKVGEYLSFYASAYNICGRENYRVCSQLLELMDLSSEKDVYVDCLSRGMKQKLCLARCLVHNPDLLVLDEPASGMDPKVRLELRNILKTLKDMGKTIIISSHVLSEMEDLCTAIGIMDKGRLTACGAIEEIMEKAYSIRSVRIEVRDRVEDCVIRLKEFTFMDRISVDGNIINASYHGGDDELGMILQSLVIAGIPVITFSRLEGSIRDIFIKLTEGREENE